MIDGQNGRPFNEWLRAQLRVKHMSQRQLAQQSGVDHSTISRLIRGDRTPSLETATKLARGLRELREDQEPTQYLGVLQQAPTNPVARVEYALRADETLDEADVRHIMETYLSARIRRLRGAVARVTRAGETAPVQRPYLVGSNNGNGHGTAGAPLAPGGPHALRGPLRRAGPPQRVARAHAPRDPLHRGAGPPDRVARAHGPPASLVRRSTYVDGHRPARRG